MIRLRDLGQGQKPATEDEPEIAAVTIRSMRLSDIEAVSKLERRSMSLPWSSSAYVTEINNPNAHYLVAKTGDGAVVGYGGIWVIMDEMHITTLAVDPESRGKKVGERILIVLLEEAMRRGATRATLEVRQSNRIAQNLYHKYGFREVAMRPRYYSDNGENAVIMWAEDLLSPGYQQALYEFKQRAFYGQPASDESR